MSLRVRRLLIAVLAPVVLLAVAESIARLAGVMPVDFSRALPNIELVPDSVGDGPSPMRRHPVRFFEPTPDQGGVFATDDRGRRGGPHPARHARLLRIVLVGDSVTMGFGVRYGRSFAGVLETELRRALPELDVDVADAGCAGYSTWQNRLDLDDRVLPLEPDVVVIGLTGWNDAIGAVLFDDRTWSGRMAATERPPAKWLLASRALAAFARLLGKCGIGASDEKIEAVKEAIHRGERPDGPRVTLPQFLENLGAMIDAITAHRATPVVLLLPRVKASDDAKPESARYVAAGGSAARARGVRVLDAAPLFPALDATLFFDSVHPNEDGHRAIGEALAKMLLDDAEIDLRGRAKRAAAAGAAGSARPELSAIDPPRASAFGDVPAVVGGKGFAGESTPRFFVGGDPVRVLSIVDDATARVMIPPLAPGKAELEVTTAAGSARLESGFEALGPELVIERNAKSARIVVTARQGDLVRVQCALEPADSRQVFDRHLRLLVGPLHMFRRTFLGEAGADGKFALEVPYAGFTGDPPIYTQAIVEPKSGSWPRIALYSNCVKFGKAK